MQKWKCLNNILSGYCQETPDFEIPPVERKIINPSTGKYADDVILVTTGKCKLDCNTCGKFITLSEHEKTLPHYLGNYKDTKIYKDNTEKEVKTKAKKKTAKENLQGNLF